MKNVIKSYLERRDPQGYYVIPAKRNALNYIGENMRSQIVVEESGDVVFIRIKPRRLASQIVRILAKKNMLL